MKMVKIDDIKATRIHIGKYFEGLCYPHGIDTEYAYRHGWNDGLNSVIESRMVIEAEPVRHGEWIFQRYDNVTGNADYECSVCHCGEIHVPIVEVKYCWNCGARMNRGVTE